MFVVCYRRKSSHGLPVGAALVFISNIEDEFLAREIAAALVDEFGVEAWAQRKD